MNNNNRSELRSNHYKRLSKKVNKLQDESVVVSGDPLKYCMSDPSLTSHMMHCLQYMSQNVAQVSVCAKNQQLMAKGR